MARVLLEMLLGITELMNVQVAVPCQQSAAACFNSFCQFGGFRMASQMSQRAFRLPLHEEKHKKPEKKRVLQGIEIA